MTLDCRLALSRTRHGNGEPSPQGRACCDLLLPCHTKSVKPACSSNVIILLGLLVASCLLDDLPLQFIEVHSTMQHNSQIFLNDYELPCPGTPPPRNLRPSSPTELVPPRKQPSSTRSKSFQDRPERPPREPAEPSRDYEVVGGYLQMPSPHNSRASVNGQVLFPSLHWF